MKTSKQFTWKTPSWLKSLRALFHGTKKVVDHDDYEDEKWVEAVMSFLPSEDMSSITTPETAARLKNIRRALLKAAQMEARFKKIRNEEAKWLLQKAHALTVMSIYEEASKLVKKEEE